MGKKITGNNKKVINKEKKKKENRTKKDRHCLKIMVKESIHVFVLVVYRFSIISHSLFGILLTLLIFLDNSKPF